MLRKVVYIAVHVFILVKGMDPLTGGLEGTACGSGATRGHHAVNPSRLPPGQIQGPASQLSVPQAEIKVSVLAIPPGLQRSLFDGSC